MSRFSDRYGYTMPSEVFRREELNTSIINALCTCYDFLEQWLDDIDFNDGRTESHGFNTTYTLLEEYVWCFCLNERRNYFWTEDGHMIVITSTLLDSSVPWYEKMNLVEESLKYLCRSSEKRPSIKTALNKMRKMLNHAFSRMNYAYRVVDNQIVEITDKEEIEAIELALTVSSPVRTHLSSALDQLSHRPNPDYRNSIKESISAAEAICREVTGKNTLGDALGELEKKGIVIPKKLKSSFEKLYFYTNDKETGIRHALMDDTQKPGFDEAKYMLVVCTAFVNYIQSKKP